MWYLFEESFSNIRHGGFVSLLSVVIVTLTVTIASALILIGNYLQGEIENLKDRPAIIIFLKDTIGESEGQEFRSQIEKLDWASSVIYVSKKRSPCPEVRRCLVILERPSRRDFQTVTHSPPHWKFISKKRYWSQINCPSLPRSLGPFTHQVEDVTSEQARL